MTILQKLQSRIDLVIESKKESNSKVVLESLECLYNNAAKQLDLQLSRDIFNRGNQK